MRVEHPTDRPNFCIVHFDTASVAFSYETPIGISTDWHWIVRENDWGPTTGKHINYLSVAKDKRVSSEEFNKIFDSLELVVKPVSTVSERPLTVGVKEWVNDRI